MASHTNIEHAQPLDFTRWKPVPIILMSLGTIGAIVGLIFARKQFLFSWLTAYMFFLSIILGSLFLVIVHHLFDANWSVPLRRINEHMACLSWVMAILFIPILIFPKDVYGWMTQAHPDHALLTKYPLLTMAGFYIASIACFVVWIFFSFRLRHWSLEQDKTGAAICTLKMRVLASFGVVFFALSLTMAAILWMKALQHNWFSTMYGVWYFAGSAWLTLATLYVITATLKRQGPLREVVGKTQFYFIGSLLFAFTVFHAYVTFSQYFIIWNANIPEETFWYVWREKGTWYSWGIFLIFGHFFIPFLSLLRIDAKLWYPWMLAIAIWAWIMHYWDVAFNILPVIHPEGVSFHWLDLTCFAFFAGILSVSFIYSYFRHPPFPQKDPRMAETLGLYLTPPGGPRQQAPDAANHAHG
jgi:hypothetical protein